MKTLGLPRPRDLSGNGNPLAERIMPAHLIAQASINGNSNGVISPRKRLKFRV